MKNSREGLIINNQNQLVMGNHEPKSSFTARLDMKISPVMKEKLIALAEKDRRELSDFIRLYLEKLIK